MARKIGAFLKRLRTQSGRPDFETRQQQLVRPAEPVYPKVLIINFDPVVPSERGQRLSNLFGWNRVDELVAGVISDLNQASHGYCNYQVDDLMTVDVFPVKIDGFSYSAADYVAAWRAGSGFHQPDWADYRRIMIDFEVADRLESGTIDELWLFGFPYGGFYESRMAGPGAFWCNAPPLEGFNNLPRRFVIMGFNYERAV